MKEKGSQNMRGITLISLVITIIVLLILAGVAVSMALNEGNLFAKANEAKTSWNEKTEEEETRLISTIAMLYELSRVTSDQKVIVTSEPVKTNEMTSGSISVTLKYGENNDAIPTDYVMQYQEKTDGVEGEWQNYTAALPYTVTQVATENSGKQVRGRLYNDKLNADTGTGDWFIVDWVDRENPSAPTAITKVSSTDTSITVQASGGNDDSGSWLYEYKIGDEDWSTAKATTETHTFTGLSIGNTYTIQARTKDSMGKYSETTKSVQISLLQTVTGTIMVDGQQINVTAPIPAGYKVSIYEGETNISEGLVIYQTTNELIADTGDSTTNHDYAMRNYNQFVWIPVLSADEYVRNWSYHGNVAESNSYIYPEALIDVLGDSSNTPEEYAIIEKDAVLINNGFYISRYEAGKMSNSNTPVSIAYCGLFTNLTLGNAINYSKLMYGKTAICSGIQWDMVMKFVDGKKDGFNEDFNVEETVTSRHRLNNPLRSGLNNHDKVQNIYDLEGNAREMTSENNNNLSVRGGFYSSDWPKPACYRRNEG